ncbi:MAG TPA: glycoside hydrolase family 3 protein [Clostridia bacterium]
MRKFISEVFILFFIFLLLTCCANNSNNSINSNISNNTDRNSEKGGATPSPAPVTDPVAELMDKMTVEEKIGQLFIVSYRYDHEGSPLEAVDEDTRESIKKYKPGGVILFAENVRTIPQTVTLIESLQELSRTPLFIAVDEEGGIVSRITKSPEMHATKFPDNAKIGETGDPELAEAVARAISAEISSLGFNMNFAPVADINSNPDNTVIGRRAYGSDAGLVSKMVSAAVSGIQSEQLSAVLKHFPGHGDTIEDSHYGSASVSHSKERLFNTELLPFISGIEAGADCVMAAHILTPNIKGENVPATLKHEILTGILRNELGFNGLIITDAMNMGAITRFYKSDEAAVKAIIAGADIVLMPEDLELAVTGVKEAVDSGKINVERLNESVMRILRTKQKRGILNGTGQTKNPENVLGCEEHRELANRVSK